MPGTFKFPASNFSGMRRDGVRLALRARAPLAETANRFSTARPNVENASSQRPQQTLVSRRCQQVAAELIHRERHVAQRLRCIDEEHCAALMDAWPISASG